VDKEGVAARGDIFLLTMELEEVGVRFEAALREAGVDIASPDPPAAWIAFKRFAGEPIDGLDPADDRDRLLFEAGYDKGRRERPPSLYLSFQRQYTLPDGGMRYALCSFNYSVDDELAREPEAQRWGRPGEASGEWVEAVEASPFFVLIDRVPARADVDHGDM
jgi:hypothetical protein